MSSGICTAQLPSVEILVNTAVKPKLSTTMFVYFKFYHTFLFNSEQLKISYTSIEKDNNCFVFFYKCYFFVVDKMKPQFNWKYFSCFPQGFVNSGYGVNGIAHVSNWLTQLVRSYIMCYAEQLSEKIKNRNFLILIINNPKY